MEEATSASSKVGIPLWLNAEITFRPRGAGDDAPVRVHRHIAANLAN